MPPQEGRQFEPEHAGYARAQVAVDSWGSGLRDAGAAAGQPEDPGERRVAQGCALPCGRWGGELPTLARCAWGSSPRNSA
eukprot:6407072-Alexandrium_andersonii.AAC.1